MITKEEWEIFVNRVDEAKDKYGEIFIDFNPVIDVYWIAEQIVVQLPSYQKMRYDYDGSIESHVTLERIYSSVTYKLNGEHIRVFNEHLLSLGVSSSGS